MFLRVVLKYMKNNVFKNSFIFYLAFKKENFTRQKKNKIKFVGKKKQKPSLPYPVFMRTVKKIFLN